MNVLWQLIITALAALFGAASTEAWKHRRELSDRVRRFLTKDWGPRKRGQVTLAVGVAAILAVALWGEVLSQRWQETSIEPKPEMVTDGYIWITYEPSDFDPNTGQEPSLESIERELGWISEADFTGIITFTSRGVFSAIPELASREGLAVIMGVWDPNDKGEVDAAISKREYVVGYTVGHNHLNDRDGGYSFEQLNTAMKRIRSKTGRPVSTTARRGAYSRDKRLLTVGDWVFPDAHVRIQGDNLDLPADALRDVDLTIEMAKDIAEQEERGNIPILLNLVTYAVGGVSNATQLEQAAFFAAIFEARIDDSLPAIAVHSSFDTPWKTGRFFYDWDPFTGLFEFDGTPRPAVKEIMDRSR